MSDRTFNDYMTLGYEAGRTPAALPFFEAAARLADAEGDVPAGIDAREEIIEIGYFCGHQERALIAFSWIIARYDENPERLRVHDLLWKYKWICEHFPFMHQVPREKVEATLQDMSDRLRQAGYNQRSVLNLRAWNALWMGDLERARGYRDQWRNTPRDSMADCIACEINYDAQYLFEDDDWPAALKTAEPLLSERRKCAEIPHITLGYILRPVLELQGEDAARAYHSRGYALVRENRDFVMEVGEHVAFAAHVGDLDTAMRMFERHAPWTTDSWAWLKDAHLYAAAEGACEQALAAGRDELAIRLPRHIDVGGSQNLVGTEELQRWLSARRSAIGEAFDGRNGTDWVSRRLARLVEFARG